VSGRPFDAVCDAAGAALERIGVPGASVAVLHEEREEVRGLGVTSVDNPLEVTPDTLFQIGSVTKVFTATAVMILAGRGKLDLDEPVRRYVPDVRFSDDAVGEAATLRHLLTHTGGWLGDYFDDFGWGDDALTRLIAQLPRLPQLSPLGALWSYNNIGFALAGRAIEAVAGQAYESALRELVLAPLGMERSFFFPAEVMTERFAVGHHRGEGDAGTTVARPWPVGRAMDAAGGLVSTPGDLLRFAQLHLGLLGDDLLSSGAREAMQTQQVAIGDMADAVGLAWLLHDVGGRSIVRHGGTTNGQCALLSLVPDAGFAFVCLTNHGDGHELIRHTAAAAHRAFLGLEEPEPQTLELTEAELGELAGRYEAALTAVELVPDAGGLRMTTISKGGFPKPDSPPLPVPPPARVAFVDTDRVVVPDGPLAGTRGSFLRGPDGRIEWFRVGGRVHRREPA
jgi:CubicO group peptidase (beta-lactamase class C family)